MRVASIPTVIVEKWMKEGFNIFDQNVDGKDIIKRLKAEGLDAFLTTEKSICKMATGKKFRKYHQEPQDWQEKDCPIWG